MKARVVTFYIVGYHDPDIVKLHEAVVRKFLPPDVDFEPRILPIASDGNGHVDHGRNIDCVLRDDSLYDVTIVLEADAAPTNRTALLSLLVPATQGKLVGVAQVAMHLNQDEVYASPAAFAIRKDVYEHIGSPSAVATASTDTGTEITRAARRHGVPVELFWSTSVEGRSWGHGHFPNGTPFGAGITYENGIFHCFSSYAKDAFAAKCHRWLRPRITVYTAIDGGKDALRQDQCWGEAEWVAFVDVAVTARPTARWFRRPVCKLFHDPRRNARCHKLLPHLWLPDADYSIWLDGNLALKVPPEEMVRRFGSGLALFAHPARDCIYHEARYVANNDEVQAQLAHYLNEAYPVGAGLWESGVIVRKHMPDINAFNEAWWAELCRWAARDQLSLPPTVHRTGRRPETIPGAIMSENEFVHGVRHLR